MEQPKTPSLAIAPPSVAGTVLKKALWGTIAVGIVSFVVWVSIRQDPRNVLYRLEGHTDLVSSACFSPDGQEVLSGGIDTTVRLWRLSDGKEIRRFLSRDPVQKVSWALFSPDGQSVIAGSWDRDLCLWESKTAKEKFCIGGHVNGWRTLAFSPDGKRIVAADYSAFVGLFDAEKGERLKVIDSPPGGLVMIISFASHGKTFVACREYGGVELWDAEKLTQIRTFKHSALCALFSPDGKFILSGGMDYAIRAWDPEKGNEVKSFRGHSKVVRSLAFFKR